MAPQPARSARKRSAAAKNAAARRLAHQPQHYLLDLQASAGNRAVTIAVQREHGDAGGSAGTAAKNPARPAPLTMTMFEAAYPGITSAMSFDKLKVWQDIIAGWQANREVDEQMRRMDAKAQADAFYTRENHLYRQLSSYQDKAAAIEAHRKFVDEGSSRVPLDPARILKPDITAPQPWNVDAEHRFRTWAVETFSAKPVEGELSTRTEVVSQWECTEHPELEGGFHANLLWGGTRQWNTGGFIGWDDLMHIPQFRDQYDVDVRNGPNIVAARAALSELTGHINQMKMEHQALSDANAEHGVVRHVSEALGAPSAMSLMVLRLRVQENPNDTDAQAALAEKEAEAGDYPKMKGEDGIWHEPETQLAAARKFFDAGQIELATAAISLCQNSTAVATARLAGYQRRVWSGAGTAITWLERAKTAGKIASAFTGAGGIVRASLTAAGYSFAQEGSEQVVAHWMDPTNKIDVKGLLQQSAIDGLAAMLGGVTQGAFVEALTVRFGARMVAAGLSEATTRMALSAAGATAASFYNVPAKMVLDKIIAGKAMPSSLSDVCDMVVKEAVNNGAMDIVGGCVHASGAHADEPAAAGKSGVGEPTTAGGGAGLHPSREVVEALAGPEGARMAQGSEANAAGYRGNRNPPAFVSAEARALAGQLTPLRQQWHRMSPKERLQNLVEQVHASMAATGVPRPKVVFKDGPGGVFNNRVWELGIDGTLMHTDNISADDFAWACNMARHEMEHALQYFRIARREVSITKEAAADLAARLNIPPEIAEAAVAANTRRIPAELMPTGSTADVMAKSHYESIYGKGSKTRDQTYERLDKTREDLRVAQKNWESVRNDPPTSLMRIVAERELIAAMQNHQQADAAYRQLPEEIAAYLAGDELGHAVREAPIARSIEYAMIAEQQAAFQLEPLLEVVQRNQNQSTSVIDGPLRAQFAAALAEWRKRSLRLQQLQAKLAALRAGRNP